MNALIATNLENKIKNSESAIKFVCHGKCGCAGKCGDNCKCAKEYNKTKMEE